MLLCYSECRMLPCYPGDQDPKNKHGGAMLKPDGQAPKAGDIMRMPELAATFREVATKGKDGSVRLVPYIYES